MIITIFHEGLGATAEIDEVSLTEWVEVGWTRAEEAPTHAGRAAESAPPRPKKAAPHHKKASE